MAETLTLEQARLAAHEAALRTDAVYRRAMEIAEQLAERGRRRRADRRTRPRRICSLDELPMVRAFMRGPKWQRSFQVRELCLFPYRSRRLVFTLEEDVRERVLEEVRPGVYAQWTEPLERFGVGSEGE